MIYAPPSREKSKQTMRSPMLDKNAGLNVSQLTGQYPNGPSGQDEYMMQASLYSGGPLMSNPLPM